ncbi:rhomboid family intramembrane serine protease [Desulfohalobiaceae bacterium Ax17]|uniref:rhomboid family intramembrane serine protease n=1 Tax=Desulfovulcanus ferrireducens TaxID=2831190 RepID=UPI00207BA781|nr:rhomboid family intramembrane serine protease [Desulfovulcanus ferrireducens]MBT8762924.1 rhomboid family intramembrane serine protease [Desulfovulcanus ferrireducens]
MIPLRDSIPNVHRPVMVWTIIAVNTIAFLFVLELNHFQLVKFFHLFGVVPARFTHPEWARWMGYPDGGYISLITHMFLHSGWLHFLGNMWTLWIFADNIEDVMGPFRFLVFYLLCGLCSLLIHFLFNMDSAVPVVGASGAIAGVMGAYFLLYPHAKVVTFIPIFFVPYIFELPALIFLGFWFLIQIISAISSNVFSSAGGGVAWWGHAGGFLAGMLLLSLFKNEKRCYYCYKQKESDHNFHLK